ncbi:hypothetical protein LOD99_14794 [Oopsacas minuta]|uniref:Calcineurin-like phosphoesterase domain-containing protein n=1 Tax=Oopsacas minuta TaxID=111878 RepID=A0AAV7KD23_9METZ|nr:hypothetical protein LOD99_14794 [Oopsacas minuta]
MAYNKLITILHVTDIHDSFDNIKALELQLNTDGIAVDIILVSGDISTMPMGINPNDLDLIATFEKSVIKVLTELFKICPKVVYIPGNHDPINFFNKFEYPLINDNIINLHKDMFRIADGLVVVGFGGSLPGYKSGVMEWDGFPHHQTDTYEAELEPFLARILSNNPEITEYIAEDDVIILMTHVGPDGFPTAIDYTEPNTPITCGSTSLRKCLLSNAQNKVILNIHGHTHVGIGHNLIGKITVSNPGPLKSGKYGLYTFSRLEKLWKITSIHLNAIK